MKKKPSKQEAETLFINECLKIVPDIYRDTVALFKESGEKLTKSTLLQALTDLSMEAVDFRLIPMPDNYDAIYKKLKALIKKEYL